MPWQGSAPNQSFVRTDGTRSGATTWATADAAGVDIIPSDHDTHDEDIADSLNLALKKDGGNTATADIPMGGFTLTGCAAAGADAEPVIFSQYHSLLATLNPGLLHGLTLSNNSTDATNDIDIAAGFASDDGGNRVMQLSSTLVKRLDAAWAVGTNAGGLDTGSIANTTYHVWLIRRSDTGVVDALFSTSASSPTMPTDYDQKRRIGSIIRASAAILAFWQDGDVFQLQTGVLDVSLNADTAWALTTLDAMPAGIMVQPILWLLAIDLGNPYDFQVGDARDTGENNPVGIDNSSSVDGQLAVTGGIFTNTSRQIHVTLNEDTAGVGQIIVRGWIDDRGRSA